MPTDTDLHLDSRRRLEHLGRIRNANRAAAQQTTEMKNAIQRRLFAARQSLDGLRTRLEQAATSSSRDARRDEFKKQEAVVADLEADLAEATDANAEASARFQQAGLLYDRVVKFASAAKLELPGDERDALARPVAFGGYSAL